MRRPVPNHARRRDRRVFGWLGFAGADALGRLAMLTVSTALFSRWLSPNEFGVTALALTFVSVASVFVGVPFEEALARSKHLRRIHLSAAVGVSCVIGLCAVAVAALAGYALARAYAEPQLRWMTPAAMLSVFFTGHTAILVALARRLRRFNDVAVASLAGHAFGIGASLTLGYLGAGPWALIANRVLIFAGVDLVLQWRLGHLILPRWSPRHVAGFGRFAGVSFLDRLADNLTYLLFNNFVEAIYGANVLGFVNMAMRVVEPVRGAVEATGHNLAFSFFVPVASEPRRLGEASAGVISQSSLIVAPMFFGLAAAAPALIPLMAGPGWEPAVGVCVCLAIGAALAQPPRLIFTALSAAARPEFSLYATLASLVAIIAGLMLLSPLGPISVGLARILGDGVRFALALLVTSRALDWARLSRLRTLAPAFVLSAAMALTVVTLGRFGPTAPVFRLLVMVGAGVAIYAALLAAFAPTFLSRIASLARPGWRAA